MAVRAFVVDLDGTVWDSRSWYAGIIASAGTASKDEVLQDLKTTPVPTLIDRTPGVSRSQFASQISEKIADLPLYPLVHETLDDLVGLGTRLVAATSLPRWIARPMLQGTDLDRMFSSVADASNSHRKPSPRVIDSLLPDVELSGDSIYVVGDDSSDAELSRRAGVGFAWAAYGYGSEPDLPMYQKIESFSEILDL